MLNNLIHLQVNNWTKAQQRSTELVTGKTLEEYATVFQHDKVYDDMEKKETFVKKEKKKLTKKYKIIKNTYVSLNRY